MAPADDLAFGPEGGQWHYKRETKTFDLTRGSSGADTSNNKTNKFTVGTTQGPADTKIELDPAKTALVIVDMQNFFLDPKCMDHPTGVAAVEPLIGTIAKCRELGIEARTLLPLNLIWLSFLSHRLKSGDEIIARRKGKTTAVIWLTWGLTDADLASMPAGVLRGFANSLVARHEDPVHSGLGVDLGAEKGRTLYAGAWNSEVVPRLAASPVTDIEGDVFCAKNRMSGMWTPEQPLYKHLEKTGKTSLLFAGVNTDECVLGTLVDAYNAGWDCVLLDDCCGTTTPNGHEVTVYNLMVSKQRFLFPTR
ncbi:Uu.00g031820.m01.CDS01 [Anthostomella pinea]|uniref:Uu.00g031820.m01.CDS01 n=1 Tax=Anthostomella pinea TaxID=933095 RepID=A0AAI8V8J7_9PEZI|nr:Uu.00g031820.m01.CDS01 [Anthostomella pinea]